MNGTDQPADLTTIQRKILQTIKRLTHARRRPPSMREVADSVGLESVGGLSYQYRELRAKGYLRWEAGRPRTVEARLPGDPPFPPRDGERGQLPGDTDSSVEADEVFGNDGLGKVVWVPIVGRIAAGHPILAEESIGERMPLPRDVVGSEEGLFILEVAGDSMIGVGIFPGDWVVVRRLFQAPQNGDIVAATIDGIELEGTVKTYKKVGRHVWLMPQNPSYTPIPGSRARFAGKVVAVLRRV